MEVLKNQTDPLIVYSITFDVIYSVRRVNVFLTQCVGESYE